MNDIIVIGIAGGTGSGKTTITRKLIEHFGSDVTVLYHDNYYKAHHELSYEERTKLNYDHPEAFDTDLMVRDLAALKRGEPIECPIYDYTIHDRTNNTLTIRPSRVIVVEGILIFQSKELRDLMDIRLFVDTDADVRILRRIQRDVKERGRSLDSVINQYLNTVKPMHEAFVEPSKKFADVIIPEGGQNQVALDMVINREYMTFDEYQNYQLDQLMKKYWNERSATADTASDDGLLSRIPGFSEISKKVDGLLQIPNISINPSGSADLTFQIVNNFRDRDNDREAGKNTIIVRLGAKSGLQLYLGVGIGAIILGGTFLINGHILAFVFPFIYLALHIVTYIKIKRIYQGKALNLCLGETARNIFIYGVCVSVGLLLL